MAANGRHLLVFIRARDDGVYHKPHSQKLGEWSQPQGTGILRQMTGSELTAFIFTMNPFEH